jgi:hypothetical protein
MTRPTIAILAHFGDAGAMALTAHLRRRRRVEVLFADEHALAYACFVHRPPSGLPGTTFSGLGSTSSIPEAVYLSDGSVIDRTTDLIVSRLATFAPPLQSTPSRQEYADAEVYALALSWLYGLGDRVVNRPSPTGLVGGQPDVLRLASLAADVGLATPRVRLTNNGSSAAPPGWTRLCWSGLALPGAYPTETVPAAGPPLPMPAIFTEPVRFLCVAAVAGERVVGAPRGLDGPTAVLVAEAELDVAEVTFGVAWPSGAPLVLEVRPTPRILDIAQLDLLASYFEQRASKHHAARAA